MSTRNRQISHSVSTPLPRATPNGRAQRAEVVAKNYYSDWFLDVVNTTQIPLPQAEAHAVSPQTQSVSKLEKYLLEVFDEDETSRFNYYSHKDIIMQIAEYENTPEFIKTMEAPITKFSVPEEVIEHFYKHDTLNLYKLLPPTLRARPLGVADASKPKSIYLGFACDEKVYKIMLLEFNERPGDCITDRAISTFFNEVFKHTFKTLCDVLNYDMLIHGRYIPSSPLDKMIKTKVEKMEKSFDEYGIQSRTMKRVFLSENGYDPKKYSDNIRITRGGSIIITIENLNEEDFRRLTNQYFEHCNPEEVRNDKNSSLKRNWLINNGFDPNVYDKYIAIKKVPTNFQSDYLYTIKIPNLDKNEFLKLAAEFFEKE